MRNSRDELPLITEIFSANTAPHIKYILMQQKHTAKPVDKKLAAHTICIKTKH